MKRLFLILSIVASFVTVGLVTTAPVLADDRPSAEKTTFTFNGKRTNVGIMDVVIEVFKFGTVVVGILAVGGYAYAGIVYSTSGGNPGQTQKAIVIIGNTTFGIIAYFGLYGIAVFFIPENILK